MTVDLGRSLIVRHSLTFDLCCVTGSLILVFHIVACWMLVPSILQTSPYIFLQAPLPSVTSPLDTSSPVSPSKLTTLSTDGAAAAERHLANQRPTTTDDLQWMLIGSEQLTYGDDNSTLVAAAATSDAEIKESASNWTTSERLMTTPFEGGNTPLPGQQSSSPAVPEAMKTTEETGGGSHCPVSGFDPSPSSNRRYVTKVYASFCIASTVLTTFELVRCVVMCRRHRNMIKNDVDGLPPHKGGGGGLVLFDVFLPEFLLFFLLLVDDLPISGLILASQTSIGCDLTVSASGTALFVTMVSTAIASSWKLCVVLCRLWRRRYYGNGWHRNQVLLVIVRISSLLLVVLSLVLITLNFLLMSGSKDLLSNNPLLYRLFRGAGSKFWNVDDGWISLIVRRSTAKPSNNNGSGSGDFRHQKTMIYETSAPVIRWTDLLVLPPDTGSTVISVPCSLLEDWFFVVAPDSSGFHDVSKNECGLYFRFNFFGERQIRYNAWYCIVPRRTNNSSAYQSGSFPTESHVEWNCGTGDDDGEIQVPTNSSTSDSIPSAESFWNDPPAESYPTRGKNETCWVQMSLGFWPTIPSSPLWTGCHYHFTQYDSILPETPCGKRR